MLNSLWRRTLINEIDNTHIWYASIRLKTDFTSSTVRVAYLDVISLNLWTELA